MLYAVEYFEMYEKTLLPLLHYVHRAPVTSRAAMDRMSVITVAW